MKTNPLLQCFHPVLKTSELGKKPRQILLGGRKYVLFRDGGGNAACLADQCPHRHAPLSAGTVRPDGRLACAYHGWNFDGTGHGRSPSQPSMKCDTVSFQVVERFGYFWIADRGVSMDKFPLTGVEGFEYAGAFTHSFAAPLFVALDNFSEDEHFPYVHSFFGWSEKDWPEVKHEFHNKGDYTEIHYEGPQRPSPLLPFLGVKKGDLFHNDWITRFDPLQSVFTFHWYNREGLQERPFVARAAIFMTPETETTTRFHTFLFLKFNSAFLRLIKPVVRRVALHLAHQEITYDAEFIPLVAGTQPEIRGMRLGKYDRGVTEHRKLARRLYWPGTGEEAGGVVVSIGN